MNERDAHSLTSMMECADGFPDRASGGAIDVFPCAPADHPADPHAPSEKFSWPPAVFHLLPVPETFTKDHVSSTSPRRTRHLGKPDFVRESRENGTKKLCRLC
jgi:hypothetical protein